MNNLGTRNRGQRIKGRLDYVRCVVPVPLHFNKDVMREGANHKTSPCPYTPSCMPRALGVSTCYEIMCTALQTLGRSI